MPGNFVFSSSGDFVQRQLSEENIVLSKRFLNPDHTLFELIVRESLISQHARGGNFVILRNNETGERFPLTIADYDREARTITMVVMAIGKSTKQLSNFKVGDRIEDIVGPLGKSIPIIKFSRPIIFIGGGVGIAPLYPQVKEMKAAGNMIITILGARSKELLFWVDKFKAVSDKLIVTTDDGSYGRKGFVTDRLEEVMRTVEIDHVTAIGPLVMMKAVAQTTDTDIPIPTTVSLNTLMVDGTGMCGGCRFLTREGETQFACVDGPDVNGHDVDFDNLIQRNRRFVRQEREAMDEYEEECRAVRKLKQEQEGEV
jgi:ferredoxin--NADP+ reductase